MFSFNKIAINRPTGFHTSSYQVKGFTSECRPFRFWILFIIIILQSDI